jgi:hypothetical protein
MTIRSEVDRLIDWYEKHCLIVGRVIPVLASKATVAKFARKRRLGPYIYRNCELVPIGKARERRQVETNKQMELTHESGNIADHQPR